MEKNRSEGRNPVVMSQEDVDRLLACLGSSEHHDGLSPRCQHRVCPIQLPIASTRQEHAIRDLSEINAVLRGYDPETKELEEVQRVGKELACIMNANEWLNWTLFPFFFEFCKNDVELLEKLEWFSEWLSALGILYGLEGRK